MTSILVPLVSPRLTLCKSVAKTNGRFFDVILSLSPVPFYTIILVINTRPTHNATIISASKPQPS